MSLGITEVPRNAKRSLRIFTSIIEEPRKAGPVGQMARHIGFLNNYKL
jgi:hypothetical protein